MEFTHPNTMNFHGIYHGQIILVFYVSATAGDCNINVLRQVYCYMYMLNVLTTGNNNP